MPRKLLPLAALLMCGTALAGCQTMASLNPFGDSSAVAYRAKVQAKVDEQVTLAPPSDVAGGVAQAHALRLAGKYDDASRILSQLMLVASDDPGVVGEYGKTLLERGQPQDAAQFLSRAVQLRSGDWTNYSALGVSYDQLGNPAEAKIAYEHALALNPGEASVLSNYALSRMIANDVGGARVLAARAESAGGSADPKIARNISMILALAPAEAPVPVAALPQPPRPVASAAPVAPVAAAPQVVASAAPVKTAALNLRPATVEAAAPPRLLMPAPAYTPPPGAQPLSGAVSEALPVKPVAAPVAAVALARVWATPNPLRQAKAAAPKTVVAKSANPFIPVKPVAAVSMPVKAAAVAPVTSAVPLKAAAAAPSKPVAASVTAKAAAVTPVQAKTAAMRPAPVKTAAAQPTPAVPADKSPAPAKADKPAGVPALRLASDYANAP